MSKHFMLNEKNTFAITFFKQIMFDSIKLFGFNKFKFTNYKYIM